MFTYLMAFQFKSDRENSQDYLFLVTFLITFQNNFAPQTVLARLFFIHSLQFTASVTENYTFLCDFPGNHTNSFLHLLY